MSGLGVEFCVHIVRSFTVVPSETKKDANSRVLYSLNTIGESVIKGITLTKFIGVCVLAFAQSKIFDVFYFRMWFTLIIVAALHALLFLPALLSLFGGKAIGTIPSKQKISHSRLYYILRSEKIGKNSLLF